MALLDKVFKQRMVGALVLIAVAVIFLPMLFTRQDEVRQVQVEAPAAPQAPVAPQVKVDPVPVPEPQILPQEPVPGEEDMSTASQLPPSMPIAPAPPVASAPAQAPAQAAAPAPAPKPAKPAPAATPAAPAPAPAPATTAKAAPSGVDANGLSVSWSVQLASMSNRANADNLQKTLRAQGYNAYIRTADGVNRVFVGPLIERAEADRLRDQLDKQQKLKGIVVRFQPERG
ncbi:SPOR domain-containing protein [Pseudomonas cichorii]|nr:SPOR domain-containing protein [Pseudomonas cichorii]MBX8508208.1 SPOR domain-containing protein [Pseudomonas cichorii]MBX8526177.1 SPOR domain-containing protein [Pseudomonas cichorii]MBX8533701.1 SPOR domain-containing protein [Pseudomonas cichorii]MBX8543635.1 SPOR domain-containing protein [Pseudomonas cichorii]MBX8558930.1 SPOR domain-containing protein [Pseudomonas cichorii]